MARILLVDDEKEYGESLSELLRESGYEVDFFENPWRAIEISAKKNFDLIIADYDMPKVDGFKLIEIVRNIQEDIKTVLLTGYNEEKYEMKVLENNIDLFLIKEKSFTVIKTYIKSVLSKENESDKRRRMELSSTIENIILNRDRHEVYKDGNVVDLTPREFQLLEYFLSNKDRKISRAEMIEKIWLGEITETDFRVIDVHVRKLREKLNIFCIVSIRGFGYKWNEK